MIPNFLKECRNPTDLYATLQPLFLVSFIVGVTPLRITGSTGKRKVEVSFFGFLNTLFTTCVFSICFILAIVYKESLMGYFFDTSISMMGDMLHKFAGYLGMTIIFTSCIFRRNTLIELVNLINDVDVWFLNVGVSLDYCGAIRFSFITIIAMCFLNVGYLLSSYLLITNVGIQPSFSAFVSFFSPHIILSIVVLLFTCFTYKIKLRYAIVNQILQNLSLDIADKYRAPIKSGNSSKCESFSMYTIVSKSSSEVIDDSMQVHSLLCDAASTANKYFTYQLLTIISISFLIVVFDAYYVLETVLGQSRREIHFNTTEFVVFFSCQMALYMLAVFAIVEGSSRAINQSQKTASLVHKLLNSTKNESLKEKLSYFSLQLIHEKVQFTAAGLFNIDRTLYFTISGAATTYLIILLQFTSSDAPTSPPVLCNGTHVNA